MAQLDERISGSTADGDEALHYSVIFKTAKHISSFCRFMNDVKDDFPGLQLCISVDSSPFHPIIGADV